jgi:D-arabinose 1-dehydrogenase-like Zn-dependent alcohol dehydrogenase
MKVAQISKPGGNFELVEREIPQPGSGQVRIKVEACGICHSDVLVKDGLWPGLQYPRVPGHEVAGRVDALGDRVTNWKQGAHHYIDSEVVDPIAELQKLGGARIILATAPSAKAISSVVGVNGSLLIPAAPTIL